MSSRSPVVFNFLNLTERLIQSHLFQFGVIFLFGLIQSDSAQAQLSPSTNLLSTVAESSDFTRTATVEEVQDYLQRIVADWAAAELISLGETVEGRPIQAVSLNASLPPAASENGLPIPVPSNSPPSNAGSQSSVDPVDRGNVKLTVLVMGGIHPGECDGKEAILAYLRDLKQSGLGQLETLRLVFLPLLNADGEARRGLGHRPGQVGPSEGMGVRENAQGLDLNRDFVKLESPEVRSLVSAIASWDVDVLIDLHTTNGSLHRYDLTYDIPHHPAVSSALDDFLRTDLLPAVTARLDDKEIPTFYYGNFDSKFRRWETFGHQPRYSTEYMGLRGKIGILVESYSYASYERRFQASYHFVDQTLRHLAENVDRIREMMQQDQNAQIVGAEIPVAGKLSLSEESVIVRGYETESGTPAVPPVNADSESKLQPRDYSVELWNRAESTRTASLPAAYAIDADYAWAVGRLLRHGVPVFRLSKDQEVAAEIATITEAQTGQAYQGHQSKSLKANWRSEPTVLASGTFVIPSTGSLARLVASLLEPESDDSLATWNFFDPALSANSDYPVLRIKELPEMTEELSKMPRTEILTLEKLMQPGSTIKLTGGNLAQSVSWLPGSESIEAVYQRNGQWFAMEVTSGSTRLLTEIGDLQRKLAELDGFSAAEARAAASRSRIWASEDPYSLIQHRGELYLYQRNDASIRKVASASSQSRELVELSPTGEHVAFVRDNNLWIIVCQSGEEIALTDDGTSELLNGKLDWVYQEELYGRGNFKGYWWSPDGKQIAWLQLDQTEVPEYLVPDSVSIAQSIERTRYPKAGQPIPTVRVWISNISDGSRCEADLQSYPVEDRLVGRVSWSPDNCLWLQVLNRVQNRQDLICVQPSNGHSSVVLKETTEGWIEMRGTPHFLDDGQHFLWLSDVPDGRTHLYRVEMASGQRSALTSGQWDVKDLVTVSKDQAVAFLTGNYGNTIESHLLSVDLVQGSFQKISQEPGTHSVSVHPSGDYYIDNFSNLSNQPTTAVHSMDGKRLFILSAPINDRHESLKIQWPKLMTIPARDGLPLQTMILMPWGVGAEEQDQESNASSVINTGSSGTVESSETRKKHPVLFHIYAGPQAPIVRNQWQQRNYWWHQMLASQGYVVVLVDNRSAQGRGIADTWTIRGDMGRVELQDLEDAVSWVAKQPWADANRFGLWGWSYGGYMTAYAMTNSQSFKAGISGAPVTDWRNYDAIYTERYMDLPSANEQGYQSSSAVQAADRLHGRLMLIHGERDDNVHLSNTLQMAHALQKAGKQFDLMIYPKARHGVVDPKQRYHMHQMMTDFLQRHLKN